MFPAVGKHGKRRSCQWKEPRANEQRDSVTTPLVRRDNALRRFVVTIAARLSRLIDIHRLFHVGGVSGEELFRWQLHLAILFAGDFRRFIAQLVWAEARVVAELAYLFSRAADSLGASGLSTDLLLLSRRVLQSILGRSTRVHGRRTAQELLGRAVVPARHAKCASLLSLSRIFLHLGSCL